MKLEQLQTSFQNFLLNNDDDFQRWVADTTQAPAQRRMGVYAEAYRLRLIEALDSNYEHLHALLGDEQFLQLCHDYITAYPSKFRSIRYYGDQLADYLAREAPYQDVPYLSEFARFEWALLSAFDAADEPVFSVDEMATISADDWPAMRFGLQQSVIRLDLQWRIDRTWKQLLEIETAAANTDQPLTESNLELPVRNDYPIAWVVWRKDLRPHYRSLDVDEAWALDAALAGQDFAAICEGLCEWIDSIHAGTRAATHLKRWLTDEMLTAVYIHGCTSIHGIKSR